MSFTVDTNVLARALVEDETSPEQCVAARRAIADAIAVFVPQIVQIELCWVLSTSFGLRHSDIAQVLIALQSNSHFTLEHSEIFDASLKKFTASRACGFADCMIATIVQRNKTTLITFDKKLAKLAGVAVLK